MNTDPSIFDDNLSLVRARWPELAERLEQTLPVRGRVDASRSGEPTLRMPTDSGDEIWIHSRYRPIEEARKQVENLEIAPNDSVFILGFGLGYATLEIVRQAPLAAGTHRFRAPFRSFTVIRRCSPSCFTPTFLANRWRV